MAHTHRLLQTPLQKKRGGIQTTAVLDVLLFALEVFNAHSNCSQLLQWYIRRFAKTVCLLGWTDFDFLFVILTFLELGLFHESNTHRGHYFQQLVNLGVLGKLDASLLNYQQQSIIKEQNLFGFDRDSGFCNNFSLRL